MKEKCLKKETSAFYLEKVCMNVHWLTGPEMSSSELLPNVKFQLL